MAWTVVCSWAVVLLLIMIVNCGILQLLFYVFFVTLCPFKFCNHLDGEEKAGCFALFVFLVPHDCFVALPRGATTGLCAVCDCGIS